MNFAWQGSLELRYHLLDELYDLTVVFKFVDVRLHFLDSLTLFSDKLLVILDVLLDRIEEQMHGLFLFGLNRGNVFSESIDIRWLVDLDFVVFALLDQVADSPFCLVTQLHSHRVR